MAGITHWCLTKAKAPACASGPFFLSQGSGPVQFRPAILADWEPQSRRSWTGRNGLIHHTITVFVGLGNGGCPLVNAARRPGYCVDRGFSPGRSDLFRLERFRSVRPAPATRPLAGDELGPARRRNSIRRLGPPGAKDEFVEVRGQKGEDDLTVTATSWLFRRVFRHCGDQPPLIRASCTPDALGGSPAGGALRLSSTTRFVPIELALF